MEMDKKQQIATFRFGVIHDLVGNVELDPGEQEKLLRQKCERKRGDSLLRQDAYHSKHNHALGEALQGLGG